jgi:hypothetical protein
MYYLVFKFNQRSWVDTEELVKKSGCENAERQLTKMKLINELDYYFKYELIKLCFWTDKATDWRCPFQVDPAHEGRKERPKHVPELEHIAW